MVTRTVTVGVDGSSQSVAAAHWAAREALLRGARLDVVHASEEPTAGPVPMVNPEMERRKNEIVHFHERIADELGRRCPGLEVTARTLSGRPPAALAAGTATSDMLVLGSRGLSGVMGFVIGSVGLTTICDAEQPVVLVRDSELERDRNDSGTGFPDDAVTPAPRDVVVGVDIYQSCEKLLSFAFEEAAYRSCELQVVHAWSLPILFTLAPPLEPDYQLIFGQDLTHELDAMLSPWREKFPSVPVLESCSSGSAAQQLLEHSTHADLVMVGRRIRRSPGGTHIGHVTHGVIHHAAAPVAVIAHE